MGSNPSHQGEAKMAEATKTLSRIALLAIIPEGVRFLHQFRTLPLCELR
jgi:hypothetical protein